MGWQAEELVKSLTWLSGVRSSPLPLPGTGGPRTVQQACCSSMGDLRSILEVAHMEYSETHLAAVGQ